MNSKGLRTGYFSIDGDTEEGSIVEGYTDGSTWNGWADIALKQDQLERYFNATPYEIRICPPGHKFNPYPRSMVIVYNGDDGDDDKWVAQDYQSDKGEWFEAFPMNGYCFVEMKKLEDGSFEPLW